MKLVHHAGNDLELDGKIHQEKGDDPDKFKRWQDHDGNSDHVGNQGKWSVPWKKIGKKEVQRVDISQDDK